MEENRPPEDVEDTTIFGEFVATLDRWTGIEGTHNRGRELEDKGKPELKSKEENPRS